jgi:NDP-sugar pyrophosphorylase family protein
MIPIGGKPILEWILRWLMRNEISHIVVGVAYKKEAVIDYLNKIQLEVELSYSEHTVEGGTGEGFRLAISRYVKDEAFLAMNGDELTDICISEFANFHFQSGGLATIAVCPLRVPFGIVELNGDAIEGFREKPVLNTYCVSTGVYIFNHGILDFLPQKGNIETETFPRLAAQGLLKAYRHQGFWGTINTVKDIREVEKELLTRSVFVERE